MKIGYSKSIQAFYIYLLIVLICANVITIASNLFMYAICAFVLLTFLLYSVIRFNHYSMSFSVKSAVKYTLLDNIALFIGIVFYIGANRFLVEQCEVNFSVIALFVLSLVPTEIGNQRLKKHS